jgi:hypothetical protein
MPVIVLEDACEWLLIKAVGPATLSLFYQTLLCVLPVSENLTHPNFYTLNGQLRFTFVGFVDRSRFLSRTALSAAKVQVRFAREFLRSNISSPTAN